MKKIFFLTLLLSFVYASPVAFSQEATSDTEKRDDNPTITIELKNLDSISSEIKEIKKDLDGDEVRISYEAADVVGSIFVAGLWVILLFFLIFVGTFIFWIAMIVHAVKNPIESKAIWILILLLFYFVGALVYYFAVKRKDSRAISANVAE